MSNLGKQVLVLNRNWQAINVMTVQKALVMMATAVATAMDFSAEGHFVPRASFPIATQMLSEAWGSCATISRISHSTSQI